MQVRLYTTNGQLHASDSVSLADARADFEGTDRDFYETMTKVAKMMGSLGSLDTLSITMRGIERHFNVRHVFWVEIDWEGEELTEPEPTERERAIARHRPLARY